PLGRGVLILELDFMVSALTYAVTILLAATMLSRLGRRARVPMIACIAYQESKSHESTSEGRRFVTEHTKGSSDRGGHRGDSSGDKDGAPRSQTATERTVDTDGALEAVRAGIMTLEFASKRVLCSKIYMEQLGFTDGRTELSMAEWMRLVHP